MAYEMDEFNINNLFKYNILKDKAEIKNINLV
jgi:hypothetical protein